MAGIASAVRISIPTAAVSLPTASLIAGSGHPPGGRRAIAFHQIAVTEIYATTLPTRLAAASTGSRLPYGRTGLNDGRPSNLCFATCCAAWEDFCSGQVYPHPQNVTYNAAI
jgi:hypothetical protein